MSNRADDITRLHWIEAAKGLGVMFVILVHSIIPIVNPVTIHLSSFTIPLFFILAGLTYNNTKHQKNLGAFISSRARQYLIPYFLLYVIIMTMFVPLASTVDTYLTPDQLLFWFLYGNGPPNSAMHLWFLPVLFLGMVLFVISDRVLKDAPMAARWLLVVTFPVVAVLIQSLFAPNLVPWRLSSAFLAATFVLLGNEMRRVRELKPWGATSVPRTTAMLVILVVFLIFTSNLNGFTDIAVDNYGVNAWLYILNGTIGTILVFSASSLLLRFSDTRRLLMALGANSQEVYEIHPVTFYLIPLVALLVGFPITDPILMYNLWPARFVIGIAISVPLASRVLTQSKFLSFLFRGSFQPRIVPTSAQGSQTV
ncbi:MAG: acyltransferase [Candidatus Thorarchaeota archaeon]|nr:acyltransferase [Candidatus Thorarchaeota archaeon]